MKVFKRLFFAGTLCAAALVPLSSQAQRPMCPRYQQFDVLTKQAQTTQYFKKIQQDMEAKRITEYQQQTRLMQQVQAQPQLTNKTLSTPGTATTAQLQTATAMQPKIVDQTKTQFQLVNRTDVLWPTHPGGIPGKTTPLVVNTQQLMQSTSTNRSVTMQPVQCTFVAMQTARQQTARTDVAVQMNPKTITKTETALQKTERVIQKTNTNVTWTPVTTTHTTTTLVPRMQQDCATCHHPQTQMIAKDPRHPTLPTAVGRGQPAFPVALPPKATPLPRPIYPGAVYPPLLARPDLLMLPAP